MRVTYIAGGGTPPPGARMFSAVVRIAIGLLALLAPQFTVQLAVSYVAVLVLVLAFFSGLIAATQLRARMPALGAMAATAMLAGIGLAALAWPRPAALLALGLLALILILQAAGQLTQALSVARGRLALRLGLTAVAMAALAGLILSRPDQALDAMVLVIGALALASGIAALYRATTGR